MSSQLSRKLSPDKMKREPMELLKIERLSDNEVHLIFYVLSRPEDSAPTALQEYYENLAYSYAEAEGLKILSNIEVELNPRNDGASLSFRARPYKKEKNFGWFNHQRRKYKAG
jgi:hypothetical protein